MRAPVGLLYLPARRCDLRFRTINRVRGLEGLGYMQATPPVPPKIMSPDEPPCSTFSWRAHFLEVYIDDPDGIFPLPRRT